MDQSKRQAKRQAKMKIIKEKMKEKRIQKKAIRKQTPRPQSDNKRGANKKDLYIAKMKEGQKVVIDLQFMDQMTDKERTSLVNQLVICHSANQKSEKPLNYFITSLNGPFRDSLSKCNCENWGITLKQEHYGELFPKESLVYLTGDADITIDELDPNDVYIIGGIVDHNRLKNITLNKAKEEGIRYRKFPINIGLKSSAILTVNQVFEVLLKVQGSDWDKALEEVIPKRKLL